MSSSCDGNCRRLGQECVQRSGAQEVLYSSSGRHQAVSDPARKEWKRITKSSKKSLSA